MAEAIRDRLKVIADRIKAINDELTAWATAKEVADDEASKGIIPIDVYITTIDEIAEKVAALLEELRLLNKEKTALEETLEALGETKDKEELEEPFKKAATYRGVNILKGTVSGTYRFSYGGASYGPYDTLSDAKKAVDALLAGKPPITGAPPPGADPGTTALIDALNQGGDVGAMGQDNVLAAALTGPLQLFLRSVGLTPELLEIVRGSPADPDKAAQLATAISVAAQTGLGLLYSVGVLAEVASLGQVEGVISAVDALVTNTGIDEVLKPLFGLPFQEALHKPAQQYWASVYQPAIPGPGDLVRFVVREVIGPGDFAKYMAYQGFSSRWSEAWWEAHWVLPTIQDVTDAYHRGLLDVSERNGYYILHDFAPTPRQYRAPREMTDPVTGQGVRPGELVHVAKSDLDIYAGLQKTLMGRVDVRRAYAYGLQGPDWVQERYIQLGYEEDASLMAATQIVAAVDGLQNAVRREMGALFAERLKDADKELKAAGEEAGQRQQAQEAETEAKQAAGELTPQAAAATVSQFRAAMRRRLAQASRAVETRREEAEQAFRADLKSIVGVTDPLELWVLRYRVQAMRRGAAAEFALELPTVTDGAE